jgi:His/Glu/Gln/Arg/opine family amino acid ABC transporter permease subunit
LSHSAIEYWWVFVRGAGVTVGLSALALILGLIVGTLIALMRLSRFWVLQALGFAYVEFFRSIPILVLLFFSFFGLSYFLGIDLSPFVAATISLTLLASSALAEVVRAAIQSVGAGQWQAAYAAGMFPFQVYRYVIVPQAVRVMMGPTVSVYIGTLKDSSYAAVIGYVELMKSGLFVRDVTRDGLTSLLIVSLLYFVINYAISLVGHRVETRFKVIT